MYTLIGSPKTRAFRVLWMLEELGEKYELKPEQPHGELASLHNPSGKVPVLLVDGEPISDSVAILQFLADRHGRFTFPAGSVERARQDSFMQFGVDELEGPCWNHTKHTFALPEKLRVPEAKNTFRREFERSAKIFAKRLGERTYVMGDEFTIADIVIGHSANWGRFCGYDWPEGPASDYVARVRSRPAFSRAWDLREAS